MAIIDLGTVVFKSASKLRVGPNIKLDLRITPAPAQFGEKWLWAVVERDKGDGSEEIAAGGACATAEEAAITGARALIVENKRRNP